MEQQAPLCIPGPNRPQVLDLEAVALPNVWPLEGQVRQAYKHYYEGKPPSEWAFPPGGYLVEVSFFGKIEKQQVGRLIRDNCDVLFFAWLMLLDAVKADPAKLQEMQQKAEAVPMKFSPRRNSEEVLMAAYQYKEDEEKNRDVLGHSFLQRARELSGLQEKGSGFRV